MMAGQARLDTASDGNLVVAETDPEDVRASRGALSGRPQGWMTSAAALLERTERERPALTLSDVLATGPSRRRVSDAAGRIPDPRGMLRSSLRYGGIPIEFHGEATAVRACATLTLFNRSVTSRAVAPRRRTFWRRGRNDSIAGEQSLAMQNSLFLEAKRDIERVQKGLPELMSRARGG